MCMIDPTTVRVRSLSMSRFLKKNGLDDSFYQYLTYALTPAECRQLVVVEGEKLREIKELA